MYIVVANIIFWGLLLFWAVSPFIKKTADFMNNLFGDSLVGVVNEVFHNEWELKRATGYKDYFVWTGGYIIYFIIGIVVAGLAGLIWPLFIPITITFFIIKLIINKQKRIYVTNPAW